jgi:hypothetical protein
MINFFLGVTLVLLTTGLNAVKFTVDVDSPTRGKLQVGKDDDTLIISTNAQNGDIVLRQLGNSIYLESQYSESHSIILCYEIFKDPRENPQPYDCHWNPPLGGKTLLLIFPGYRQGETDHPSPSQWLEATNFDGSEWSRLGEWLDERSKTDDEPYVVAVLTIRPKVET